MQDELRVYGVTRCLEIISEASRRLPIELKDRHPGIAWQPQEMSIATSMKTSPLAAWSTLRDHLPPLLAPVEAEIAAIVPGNSALPRTTMVIPPPPKPPNEG